MPLEKQCASLELSKELKELGYPQESLFYWAFVTDGNEFGYSLEMHNTSDETYSAPTTAELGEMLPKSIELSPWEGHEKREYHISIWHNESDIKWFIGYEDLLGMYSTIEADTEADCRAKMLIYLLKNKFIELK